MDIWAGCQSTARPRPLHGTLLRMVESQEQVATTAIVDTLAEQALLEDLLERTKPPRPLNAERLHYLLATPWRYPPLKYGSRFGKRHEPSLFYGALGLTAVLAETAYYRFLFRVGMVTPPEAAYRTQHTLFAANYQASRGLRLQDAPFDRYHTPLTDPADYSATQQLGGQLREAGIEAFEYVSARDPEGGLNLALFTPEALDGDNPLWQEEWLCETTNDSVNLVTRRLGQPRVYDLANFTVAGELPQPGIKPNG